MDDGFGLCAMVMILAAVVPLVLVAGCSSKGDKFSPEGPQPQAAAKQANTPDAPPAKTVVVIETSMGTITAELWADKVPATVANFLAYVDDEFYDGLIFHRVIDGFMIQGGGFDPSMRQKPVSQPVRNEAAAELRNDRGTLAMARTGEVDSATSQFYINLVDNDALNQRDKSTQGFGYCAFGKVTAGMDVIDKIAKVKTVSKRPYQDVPAEPVVIKSIRRAD